MTYDDGEDEVVPELGVTTMEDGGGDLVEGLKGMYVPLGEGGGDADGDGGGGDGEGREGCCTPTPRRVRMRKWRGRFWYWIKLLFLFTTLGMMAAACVKWVWPYLMDNEIIPVLNWETTTLSPPVLAVLVIASLTMFPSLLLPSSRSMWIAGMTFGYGYGFLLCISGISVGMDG